MKITYYARSEQGGRTNNQDYFVSLIEKDWAFFVIADGLGGHPKGEEASKALCEAFLSRVKASVPNMAIDPVATLEELIILSSKAMSETIIEKFGAIDAQTTFALAWLDAHQFITAHVGDSRIYRLDKNGMIWRTPDHTPVQALFDQGEITENEFNQHPLQNRLLRSVNIYETPGVDIYVHPPLEKTETLVLCTDGLWGYVQPQDVYNLGKTQEIEKTISQLITQITQNHAQYADNISLQVIRIIES